MSDESAVVQFRHTIFQSSLMTALLDGIYDGEISVGELLGHGNFGLGTFDALDGEMIILDGICYQVRSDGCAQRAQLHQRSPFALATNFVPRIVHAAPAGLRRNELSEFVSSILPSQNYMYAVKIHGFYRQVTVRTVTKQSRPYPPMMQAINDDAEVIFNNIAGTIVGFRTPIYEKGIGVPGCHSHFIDDERTHGGHILDFIIEHGQVEVCPGTDLQLHLPLTPEFSRANLASNDLDHQIHHTEVKSSTESK
ncbi:alpha-acetolactate decarboxylase [Corynebacterium kutscheri]|uniref:Alpha-acetolactate decarboxylase n=1 Tax=Corynebacterium kutscheri TaxID=35755 RepID=A0A0F6R2K0_9CORY|nr:acetolactate decarboxylase [Corynebacterium kutscheri]AKE41708.1 alpha-acetolactate decarboxylase [Corynebacterium kutscheri]VEH10035.1 Alpha-acetolactate decarboxylase [Corynebacterium kutscheri]